jgi:hypothetical protein
MVASMSLHQCIAHLPEKRTTQWVFACLIGGAILLGATMLAMMYVTID